MGTEGWGPERWGAQTWKGGAQFFIFCQQTRTHSAENQTENNKQSHEITRGPRKPAQPLLRARQGGTSAPTPPQESTRDKARARAAVHETMDNHRIRHACSTLLRRSGGSAVRASGQLLWPRQRIHTGGGALTTQGESVG